MTAAARQSPDTHAIIHVEHNQSAPSHAQHWIISVPPNNLVLTNAEFDTLCELINGARLLEQRGSASADSFADPIPYLSTAQLPHACHHCFSLIGRFARTPTPPLLDRNAVESETWISPETRSILHALPSFADIALICEHCGIGYTCCGGEYGVTNDLAEHFWTDHRPELIRL